MLFYWIKIYSIYGWAYKLCLHFFLKKMTNKYTNLICYWTIFLKIMKGLSFTQCFWFLSTKFYVCDCIRLRLKSIFGFTFFIKFVWICIFIHWLVYVWLLYWIHDLSHTIVHFFAHNFHNYYSKAKRIVTMKFLE